MVQHRLFPDTNREHKIVNVASVPHRSPFRYPGGKTWLVPRIREWTASLPSKPTVFIEPFAGGGIVSLTVCFEDLADSALMVELDDQIAAVWQTIFNGGGPWLADRILEFDLTPESVEEVQSKTNLSLYEKAFRTVLRNRVYHGGILAPGSGVLKFGENGKGIHSRWYPETLAKRITDIQAIKHKIEFIEGDGIQVMRNYAHRDDVVFFIDPPYTAAGKRAGSRLYTHHELDHEELFAVTATVSGDFLMTYDNADSVREMAGRHGFDTALIAMKNTHHAKMSELLVGQNLDWVR